MQADGVQLPLMPIDENITANPIPKNAAFAGSQACENEGWRKLQISTDRQVEKGRIRLVFLALLSE
jgi:hypothetical protein